MKHCQFALKSIAVVVASLVASGPSIAADDPEGQLAFNNNCRTCHSTDAADNRLGPNLHQIVGRKVAQAEGYNYSSSLASADFSWTRDKLDAFIAAPESVVPGNNMKPYSGIDDADVRSAIISYLDGGAKPAETKK